MHYLLTLLLGVFVNVSYGQNFIYPEIKITGGSILDFIPPGWILRDSTSGDLNKDGIADVAIILQHQDSVLVLNNYGDTVLTQPRILLILFQNHDHTFSLVEQSNSFILTHDNPNMDDPYQRLLIKKAVLEIQFQLFYHTGSWEVKTLTYKFRYQQKQLVLIGTEYYSLHRSSHDFEACSYNFLTKMKNKSNGNIDNGTPDKTVEGRINTTILKTLKTLNEPLTWEVEPGVFYSIPKAASL